MRPVETVTLHHIEHMDPFSALFRLFTDLAVRFNLSVTDAHSISVYRLENETEVLEEFEVWDRQGRIMGDKVFYRNRRKA